MTSHYEPFRVLMELKTPIVLGRHPPHLDGVLAYAIFAHTGRRDPSDIQHYMAENLLKYNQDLGVFHGSAMALGVTDDWALLQSHVPRVGKLQQEELSSWYFKPNARGGQYTRIITAGGPTKARLNTYQAISAPWAVFWGVGNRDFVAAMLRHYIWSMGVMGLSGAAGEVGTVICEPTCEDQSLTLSNGEINRNLPETADARSNSPRTKGRLTIPYHSGPQTDVVTPKRIRKTII